MENRGAAGGRELQWEEIGRAHVQILIFQSSSVLLAG